MTKAELFDKLRAAENDPDNAPFAELIGLCILWGNVNEGDIARTFGISRSFVKRWMTGVNHPMPQIWK